MPSEEKDQIFRDNLDPYDFDPAPAEDSAEDEPEPAPCDEDAFEGVMDDLPGSETKGQDP